MDCYVAGMKGWRALLPLGLPLPSPSSTPRLAPTRAYAVAAARLTKFKHCESVLIQLVRASISMVFRVKSSALLGMPWSLSPHRLQPRLQGSFDSVQDSILN